MSTKGVAFKGVSTSPDQRLSQTTGGEPSRLGGVRCFTVVFFVHANDLVVGREQGDGHTEHEGEQPPVEALLNKEQLEGQHDEEQTADVGRPHERLEGRERNALRSWLAVRSKFASKALCGRVCSFL